MCKGEMRKMEGESGREAVRVRVRDRRRGRDKRRGRGTGSGMEPNLSRNRVYELIHGSAPNHSSLFRICPLSRIHHSQAFIIYHINSGPRRAKIETKPKTRHPERSEATPGLSATNNGAGLETAVERRDGSPCCECSRRCCPEGLQGKAERGLA